MLIHAAQKSLIIRYRLVREFGTKKKRIRWKGGELSSDTFLNLLGRRKKLMEITVLLLCFYLSKKRAEERKSASLYFSSHSYTKWSRIKYVLVAVTLEDLSVEKA